MMYDKNKKPEINNKLNTGNLNNKLNTKNLNNKPNTGNFSNKLKWIHRHVIHTIGTIDLVVCPLCREEFSFDFETGISMEDYSYCPKCGTKLGD